jgi:hypothetical protein
MRRTYKSQSVLLVIILCLFNLKTYPVDSAVLHRNLSWKEKTNTFNPAEQWSYFEGASYDEKSIPIFFESIKLSENTASFEVTILNAQYAALNSSEMPKQNVLTAVAFSTEPMIKSSIGWRKKKPYACITIIPFRKTNNGIEKLVSLDIKISERTGKLKSNSSRSFGSTSVLSTGDWYKIGTSKNGIHKLTYQSMKNMGLDVENIDPRTIRIFGNGAGMLPMLNSDFRNDDIQENAIYVAGESDGKFDSEDYILFYGQEQVTWNYDAAAGFTHKVNEYSDTTFYFITIGGTGKRITQRPSSSQSPNVTVTSYDERFEHEVDALNLLKSGRQWFGEAFDNQNSDITWAVSVPNLITSDSIKVNAAAISRTITSPGTLKLNLNGSQIGNSINVAATSSGVSYNLANTGFLSGAGFSSSNLVTVSLHFASADPAGSGQLDYFEMSCRSGLSFVTTGSQFQFRDTRSLGTGNVGQFIISNASSSARVWDVTDPLNIEEQQFGLSNSQLSFNYPTDILREYVTFSGNYYTPVYFGKVANQNLHALPQAEFIIVTNPLFLPQANALADFHRNHDNLSTHVVTTEQVFNEFSSGSQDVCAIRDLMKMFYSRGTSTDMPKYLLLFGDASYDNKHRLTGNTNFVTSYQSISSLNLTTSYISDDFFGLLDDNEGIWDPSSSNELLDISVGRLPVKTTAEAQALVNKIISYSSSSAGGNNVFGDWRNNITFVADDQDQNTHFNQAEVLSNNVRNNYPVYNVDKIYLDAYNQESTPGGQRFPDARDAIVKKLERGTLLMSYIGHGGEGGWAHERVLEVSDINGWTNNKRLAAVLTATCEFTRVDDPSRTSAGELVILNPNGGGVCLFSTSRLAYSGSNYSLATKFFTHVFQPVNGQMPTCGEVFEETKVDYNDRYTRNFLLIGDPAMRLAYPEHDVVTTSINTHPVSSSADTLAALSKVTIRGEVRDKAGNKLSTFNGVVYPTVFDKSVTYRTLGNDPNSSDGGNDWPAPFVLQKNILYKGKATVANGDFTFTFIVPKDIAYQYGYGKLSYYADNGTIDANGYYSNVVIGGTNPSAETDNTGPQVKLYMNDEKFVFGGMTDPNPSLYGVVSDANGINTVGNGIGHDITSTLDDDNSQITVLNEYYEADIDSFQSGKVKYPFKDLPEGRHTLKLKVWDVYNNSSEARTEFVVASSAELALDHVLNYPNPFTTHTKFMFEHNHPYSQLRAQIQIFTVSGKLVKTLDRLIDTEGYRSDEIEWNGLDDYGDRIGRGVYLYKVRIMTNEGESAEKFEKLVILR